MSFSAQWGFHPGGWGKPPLDEYNRPLYGDVFGVLVKPETEVRLWSSSRQLLLKTFDAQEGQPVDKQLWGELEPEEEGTLRSYF